MIKIWIGTFTGVETVYLDYFDEDNCKFCNDILQDEYDPDFIGIIPLYSDIVPIDELVLQTPLGRDSREELINDCKILNIDMGNAVLFYSGETREITKGEVFNQLIYIGEYPV